MIILKDKNSFKEYCDALKGQYNGNLPKLVFECNKELFMRRKQQDSQFMNIPVAKIQKGKFYLILYDFNGNKLYAPIFLIDYRVVENKHIIYAINLDYLPFNYKIQYFNKLHYLTKDIFDFNGNAAKVLEEKPIKLNFETIYNTLKLNGGFNYAISAFDINKIKECFGVSTNILYILVHAHMRNVNIKLMKQLSNKYEESSKEKDKLDSLVAEMKLLIESYETDVKDYYKRLRSLEDNYKLFE